MSGPNVLTATSGDVLPRSTYHVPRAAQLAVASRVLSHAVDWEDARTLLGMLVGPLRVGLTDGRPRWSR